MDMSSVFGTNPENLLSLPSADDNDDLNDDEDETLAERLVGLTEMFPDPVRQVVGGALHFSWSGSKWAYGASRVAAWFAASSAVVLFIPVMFENERHQMEEQHLQQQRQMLLGPNVAGSGFAHSGFGAGGGVVPPTKA